MKTDDMCLSPGRVWQGRKREDSDGERTHEGVIEGKARGVGRKPRGQGSLEEKQLGRGTVAKYLSTGYNAQNSLEWDKSKAERPVTRLLQVVKF